MPQRPGDLLCCRPASEMKTLKLSLKISLVATLASMLAWQLRLPHKVWPAHPGFADFLLALILCIVLQIVWSDSKSAPGRGSGAEKQR